MTLAKLFIVLMFLLIFDSSISAQNSGIKKLDSVPSAEIFESTNGLITVNTKGRNNSIYSGTVQLYNNDGSLWYEFSFLESHPLYYKNNSNKDFKPFAPLDDFKMAMKLKANSKNWNEVVVNEETKETKYTLITDPFLERERWQTYIQMSPYILFDKDKNPLRKAGDGQVESVEISDKDWFIVKWIEGDWIKVQRKPSRGNDTGWIRWRRGNEILIGFEMNNWIVPKTQ